MPQRQGVAQRIEVDGEHGIARNEGAVSLPEQSQVARGVAGGGDDLPVRQAGNADVQIEGLSPSCPEGNISAVPRERGRQ